jgi:hypothetical protein
MCASTNIKNMKKRNFLPLLQVACFALVSLLLQNCGGSYNLPIQRGGEPSTITTIEPTEEVKEQSLIEQRQEVSSLDIFPSEIWQEIFSYLKFEDILPVRAVNSDWNQLITGFRQAGIVGVENKPCHIIDTSGWIKPKEIDFISDKLRELKPATIPSFPFYQLIRRVKNLSKEFWPYLQGTQVHTLDLRNNQIGDAGASQLAKHLKGIKVHTLYLGNNQIGATGAIELSQHLQGTKVHTLNLSWNQIGDAGAIELSQHLQRTQVHTLDLSVNQIGAEGASQLAQHLQKTQVHTLNLGRNKIGATGAIELAQYLQGTKVHTLDLSNNRIGAAGAIELSQHLQGTKVHTLNLSWNQIGPDVQRLLVEQYPHIKWIF